MYLQILYVFDYGQGRDLKERWILQIKDKFTNVVSVGEGMPLSTPNLANLEVNVCDDCVSDHLIDRLDEDHCL